MSARKASPEPSSSKSPEPDPPVAISKPSRRDERYEKSDFVVQWDPQEGLMPQILGLISSPRKEVRKKRNNILLIGSNRECGSCGEGGDLVCCSRCNRCYHTLCHNPPLDDDNLPQAKWSCYNCSFDTDSEIVIGRVDEEQPSTQDDSSMMGYAFKMLLKAIEHDNSEEFQLTKEVSLPYMFAGYGKPTKKRLKEMKHARLDQGLVPTPVRTCFACDKSSRLGPLIHCDYCPLMFHADCLDPPLTIMPLSRWMCPNHPNHLVDDKLTTDRHTHRVKLWDEFCCNSITEQKVMLDFFHKNSRKDPPFNRKRIIEQDVVKVSIPSHIKAMYRAAKRRRDQRDWLNGLITMNPHVLDFDCLTVDDLGETTVKILAARMLEQLKPLKQMQRKPEPITVQPRAFITPGLGSSGPQLLITETHLTVGKCNSADINLEYYGDCKYASARHAVIFYDQVTDCFELLNYSEHGTYVDGVLYSSNVEHILTVNRSITNCIKSGVKEKKKTKEKRPPMKRGRKSKAEKAAMAAAAAAAAALAGSDVEEVDLTGWTDDKDKAELRVEIKNELVEHLVKKEMVDSEDTLSAAGRSTPAVPKSDTSEPPELNGIHNGHAHNGSTHSENDAVGDINGTPRSCICDQNNLIGRQLPSEGYEGSAILHGGSVLKIGCIVLLFNRFKQ